MVQAFWPTPSILSGEDLDEGWSWRELDTAIRSLPSGEERIRQRTHFDALTLLGVLIQHGDRKTEQQRLYCAAPVDTTAGGLRIVSNHLPMLFERPGTILCQSPAVTILDAGATFGGAGRASSGRTATMNLGAWQKRAVFATGGAQCRGNLIDSFKAGRDGEPNPVISENGRRFLFEQLRRLNRDHVRAIFTAARVDQLESDGASLEGRPRIDAWVAAFEDKVRQIGSQRCPLTEIGDTTATRFGGNAARPYR